MSTSEYLEYIHTAAAALSERHEEINRLNVFPVPDGDTGTNMSMTVQTVVSEIDALPLDASLADVKAAIIHGSLMGARGNSGVITSQILRGICDGIEQGDSFEPETIARAFECAVTVAFQAVRKPVEGTILTVLRDTAQGARQAVDDGMGRDDMLRYLSDVAYASVERTPELLPVLKENGVVDAGGFGLAVLLEGFVRAVLGESALPTSRSAAISAMAPKVEIEQINDWEGSEFTYCTEFLLFSDSIDVEETIVFLGSLGDCELLVGEHPHFKVHVHTNIPGTVLTYMTERGEVSEVHIHNMKLQSADRLEKIAAGAPSQDTAGDSGIPATPTKEIGFVAVAAGAGSSRILTALGVDCVVSGGQTMNPSTKDILDAIDRVAAEQVVVFPNNKNIILAAQQAAALTEKPVAVIPTHSVPQAFSALFAFDAGLSFEENVEAFEEAIQAVRTGEVTHAIKHAKAADGRPIEEGDVIGIVEDAIEVIGSDVAEVIIELVGHIATDETDTLTLLAGADLDDAAFDRIVATIEERYPDLEVDPQRGEQPLYPMVMSAE